MATISFTVRNGQDQGARPDGARITMPVTVSRHEPRTPTVDAKTYAAMDGGSGSTRVRGWTFEGQIVIPRITLDQLPEFIDFAFAMMYGFENPFTFDATGAPGVYDVITARVTNPKLLLERIYRREFSTTIDYVETVA